MGLRGAAVSGYASYPERIAYRGLGAQRCERLVEFESWPAALTVSAPGFRMQVLLEDAVSCAQGS